MKHLRRSADISGICGTCIMEQHKIIQHLKANHHSFTTYIGGLTDDQFVFSPPGKWSAGQQLQHIYLSIRPVVFALSLPRLLVSSLFGKAKAPGRTYDELVKTYLTKLANGGKSSAPYIPKSVSADQRNGLIEGLNAKTNSLCTKIESLTEDELDSLMLPHPLLGKLTLREMLYFTIYHVAHHEGQVRRNLG
jgi:hypothetical protein